MRSQEDILNRFNAIRRSGKDIFGFRQEALLEAMILETAKRTELMSDLDSDSWTEPDVESTARAYLLFAVGKAVSHRGLSAGRSIEKLEEWLWVLGDEVVFNAFVDADYPQYGAPKLQVLVKAWDMESTVDEYVRTDGHSLSEWRRMARGQSCTEFCTRGCGV